MSAQQGHWILRIVYTYLFWSSVCKSFFKRKSIIDGIMHSEEPSFDIKYWRRNNVYKYIHDCYYRDKDLHLGSALYLQSIVTMNPLESVDIVIDYLTNSLSRNFIIKFVLKKIIIDKYHIFLIKAKTEGIDDKAILDAIERTSKA